MPIWRLMLTIALPVAARAGGRSAVADDRIVGSARPDADAGTSQPGNISVEVVGVWRPTLTSSSTFPSANARQPAAAIRPGGTRSCMRWLTAAKIGTMIGPGATASPVRRRAVAPDVLHPQDHRQQARREGDREQQGGGV